MALMSPLFLLGTLTEADHFVDHFFSQVVRQLACLPVFVQILIGDLQPHRLITVRLHMYASGHRGVEILVHHSLCLEFIAAYDPPRPVPVGLVLEAVAWVCVRNLILLYQALRPFFYVCQ